MQSTLKTWHLLYGKLMTEKKMTLKEAVEWCKPFNGDQCKEAYEKFATL